MAVSFKTINKNKRLEAFFKGNTEEEE